MAAYNRPDSRHGGVARSAEAICVSGCPTIPRVSFAYVYIYFRGIDYLARWTCVVETLEKNPRKNVCMKLSAMYFGIIQYQKIHFHFRKIIIS